MPRQLRSLFGRRPYRLCCTNDKDHVWRDSILGVGTLSLSLQATDFTSLNSFERALAGFNFTAYCDI